MALLALALALAPIQIARLQELQPGQNIVCERVFSIHDLPYSYQLKHCSKTLCVSTYRLCVSCGYILHMKYHVLMYVSRNTSTFPFNSDLQYSLVHTHTRMHACMHTCTKPESARSFAKATLSAPSGLTTSTRFVSTHSSSAVAAE
jgi:hypothetical protein